MRQCWPVAYDCCRVRRLWSGGSIGSGGDSYGREEVRDIIPKPQINSSHSMSIKEAAFCPRFFILKHILYTIPSLLSDYCSFQIANTLYN